MGRTIEIECTADVYIDEYADKISDEALFSEVISRLDQQKSGKYRMKFFEIMGDFEDDTLIDLISSAKNLSIVQADKLKKFINNI